MASWALGIVALALICVVTVGIGTEHRAAQSVATSARRAASSGSPITLPSPNLAASPLSGKVSDNAGNAIVGALVCASCFGCDALLESVAPICGKTGPDGRYEIEHLSDGSYTILARATGYVPGSANAGTPVHFAASDAQRGAVDVRLERGGAPITGIVTDTTGGPVADAIVEARFASDVVHAGAATIARSDANGEFEITCPKGRVALRAHADGYTPVSVSRFAPSGGVELILTPAASIAGQVITEQGQPVANIRVMAAKDMTIPQYAVSDASGQFAVGNLAPGVFHLRAEGRGYIGDYEGTVTVDLAQAARDIQIVVHRSAVVEGRLVSRAGASCWPGTVHIGPRPSDYSVPLLAARTTPEGAVTFGSVPPGTYQVSARCGDSSIQELALLEVTTRDQSGLLWKMQSELEISGRVVDRRRQPISQFILQLQPDPGTHEEPRSVITGPDGRFAWKGVASGGYGIAAPQIADPVRVTLAGRNVTDLNLVADSVGDLAVHVITSAGTPVDGLSVSAMATGGMPSNLPEELGNGDYRLAALPAGSYTVYIGDGVNPRVRAGGAAAEFAVRAGETTRVEAHYGGYRGRIVGRVLDDSGAPVDNVWVEAKPTEVDNLTGGQIQRFKMVMEAQRKLSDPEGYFELNGLAEDGTFVVSAERPLGGETKVDNVKPGTNVNLVLQALGSLSGVVVDERGQPIPYFSLVLENEQIGQQRTELVVNQEGRFKIERVSPGRVQVTATDPRASKASVTWALAPKQQLADLRLQLLPPADSPAVTPTAKLE
jgi:hypothetical protein